MTGLWSVLVLQLLLLAFASRCRSAKSRRATPLLCRSLPWRRQTFPPRPLRTALSPSTSVEISTRLARVRHPPPFHSSDSPPHHPSLIADAPDALIAMLKPEGSWLFPVQQHLRWLQHVAPDAVTVSDPEDFAPWLTMVQQATHPQHRPTNLGFPQPSTHLTPSMHDVGRRIRPCSRIDNAIRDTHSQYCLMQFWCRSRMMAHLRSSKRCCRGMKTPCSPIDSDTRPRRQATTRRDAFFLSDICVFLFRCVVPRDCNAGGPHRARSSAQPHLRFPPCHRAPTSIVEVRSGCTLIARTVPAMRRLPVSPGSHGHGP